VPQIVHRKPDMSVIVHESNAMYMQFVNLSCLIDKTYALVDHIYMYEYTPNTEMLLSMLLKRLLNIF